MNPRRTFLSRLGLGATALGAVFGRTDIAPEEVVQLAFAKAMP